MRTISAGASGGTELTSEESCWDGDQRTVPPGQVQHSGLRTEPECMAYRV